MTFFYVLLAFIVGLLIGWFLWGRLRDELARAQGDLDSVRTERDRLKSDAKRLTGDLESCANARADLERQLREAKSASSSAAPLKASSATVSAAPAKPAPAKPAASSPAKAAASKPATASKTATATKPAAAKPAAAAASKPTKAPAPKPAASKAATAAKPAKPAAAVAANAAKAPAAKAAAPKTAKAKSAKPSGADDLRRLIGIGPVNERRLKEHGITTFAQIAGWTAADVKRVEEYLQFDGRIERERWIEQAKLLAAGNEKEFARRFPTASGSGNT